MSVEKTHNPKTFIISSILDNDRIDCRFFDPSYDYFMNDLKNISDSTGYELISLNKILHKNERLPITSGATPRGAVYVLDGVPFIRIQNINEMGIDFSNVVYIEKRLHHEELKRSQLETGDVLLTITGQYRISAVVPEGNESININQHVVRLIPDKSKISSDYLSMYLNSEFSQKQFDHAVTGGTRFALDYQAIKKIEILRPNLNIQKEIVENIKKGYEDIENIQSEILRLENSIDFTVLSKLGIKLPKEPKTKIFLSSIENKSRFEVKWNYPYYDDIISVIKSTSFKQLSEYKHELKYGAAIRADYVSDTPFLRIENLRRNFIDTTNIKYIPKSVYKDQIKNLYLQKGDILIERSGTYVGLCSYVPDDFADHVYGSYIIRLRLDEADILPEYLSVYLNSILGRLQFDKLKTGCLQFNINMKHIRDVVIIQPDIDVQEEIASSMFDILDKIKILMKQKIVKHHELKKRFIDLLKKIVN